jgi:hypothetical protein
MNKYDDGDIFARYVTLAMLIQLLKFFGKKCL